MTEPKSLSLAPYLANLAVGDAIGHLNLTLMPLRGEGHGLIEYLLAEQAIASGQLTVSEISQSGSVPELLVTSTTEQMILLLDGEELVGAKQNRILNTSILLPPGAKLNIPVSCVEQGRWRSVSAKFSAGGYATLALRARKSEDVGRNLRERSQAASDQMAVWDSVQDTLAKTGTRSNSMALSDARQEQRASLESYIDALPYPANAQGLLAAINGQFMVLELFDKPATLERIWPRLLAGYALDALISPKVKPRSFAPKTARTIMDTLAKTDCTPCPSAGLGQDCRFDSADFVGQSLIFQDQCIHLCAFPRQQGRTRGYTRPFMSPSRRRDILDQQDG